MIDWLVGAAGSLLIAVVARQRGALSASGAVSAVAVGTVLYACGSVAWFGVMIAFFVTSSGLTQWRRRAKAQAESGYAKTGRRDAGQVMANGGLATLLCVADAWTPDPLWWLAFVGAMAAVTADTWATEIGSLSRTPPVSILTGKRVPAGTSGGVSLIGLAAAVAGGLLIGFVAWLLAAVGDERLAVWMASVSVPLPLAGAVAGIAGALADSLIGAKWQVMYRCPQCGREVETLRHCGRQTVKVRGLAGMNNDAVNVFCSIVGGLAALLFV